MRPHTMFIQSQAVPWESGAQAGRPGAEVKVLSVDEDNGAATLVRYPAGWGASELIEDELIPVDYDAAYRPVLPEHLKRYARAAKPTGSF